MAAEVDVQALVDRVARLEAQLADVDAIQAIHKLKSRYGAVTDRRYGKDGIVARDELEALAREVANLFTEDGIWDGGRQLGKCVGRDAIYDRFLEPTLSFAWHFFVKPQIHIQGELAHGTWDILAPCTTQAGRAYWMAGVEHDRYARVEGQWLHTYMKLDMVFMSPYDTGWAKGAPQT